MIAVVGSREGEFPFISDPDKVAVFHEDYPESYYTNELCGARYLLEHVPSPEAATVCGLEHYRRAFWLSPEERRAILRRYDIIVKNPHGPYGTLTNLTCLKGCSRYGLDYLPIATEWVKRWPELRPQAEANTHWGCNMFLTNPDRFYDMMEEEFRYIDAMLEYPEITRSSISYFAETILTPYIIHKHNRNIYVATVATPC